MQRCSMYMQGTIKYAGQNQLKQQLEIETRYPKHQNKCPKCETRTPETPSQIQFLYKVKLTRAHAAKHYSHKKS